MVRPLEDWNTPDGGTMIAVTGYRDGNNGDGTNRDLQRHDR